MSTGGSRIPVPGASSKLPRPSSGIPAPRTSPTAASSAASSNSQLQPPASSPPHKKHASTPSTGSLLLSPTGLRKPSAVSVDVRSPPSNHAAAAAPTASPTGGRPSLARVPSSSNAPAPAQSPTNRLSLARSPSSGAVPIPSPTARAASRTSLAPKPAPSSTSPTHAGGEPVMSARERAKMKAGVSTTATAAANTATPSKSRLVAPSAGGAAAAVGAKPARSRQSSSGTILSPAASAATRVANISLTSAAAASPRGPAASPPGRKLPKTGALNAAVGSITVAAGVGLGSGVNLSHPVGGLAVVASGIGVGGSGGGRGIGGPPIFRKTATAAPSIVEQRAAVAAEAAPAPDAELELDGEVGGVGTVGEEDVDVALAEEGQGEYADDFEDPFASGDHEGLLDDVDAHPADDAAATAEFGAEQDSLDALLNGPDDAFNVSHVGRPSDIGGGGDVSALHDTVAEAAAADSFDDEQHMATDGVGEESHADFDAHSVSTDVASAVRYVATASAAIAEAQAQSSAPSTPMGAVRVTPGAATAAAAVVAAIANSSTQATPDEMPASSTAADHAAASDAAASTPAKAHASSSIPVSPILPIDHTPASLPSSPALARPSAAALALDLAPAAAATGTGATPVAPLSSARSTTSDALRTPSATGRSRGLGSRRQSAKPTQQHQPTSPSSNGADDDFDDMFGDDFDPLADLSTDGPPQHRGLGDDAQNRSSDMEDSPAKVRQQFEEEQQRRLKEAQAMLADLDARTAAPAAAADAAVSDSLESVAEDAVLAVEPAASSAWGSDVAASADPVEAAPAAAASTEVAPAAVDAADKPAAKPVKRSVLLDDSDDDLELDANIGIKSAGGSNARASLAPLKKTTPEPVVSPPSAHSSSVSPTDVSGDAPTTKASLHESLRAMEIARRREEDERKARAEEEALARKRQAEEEAKEREEEEQRRKDEEREAAQKEAEAAAALEAEAEAREAEHRAAAEESKRAQVELSFAETGVGMTKVPRSGAAKPCQVHLSQEGGVWYVVWSSKKKKAADARLAVSECDVSVGLTGGELAKPKWQKQFAADKSRAFSLIAPKRSLDLIADDQKEYDMFIRCIKYLQEQQR